MIYVTGVTGFTFKLCADDFGLSPAVSAGIIEAVEAGRLTATSAMSNRPDWLTSARRLDRAGHRLEVGLHLNLTLGAPLSGSTDLAPAGQLPSLKTLIVQSGRKALPSASIRAEIALQLDAFAQALGRPPDYIDGHQHVQVLPGIRELLIEELLRRGLAGKLWLRDSSDHIARIIQRRSDVSKALIVAYFGKGFAKDARAGGFACNDGFAGFSDFDPRRDYQADFARYVAAPGPRHLVMCHPGRIDAELVACDPVTTTRAQELEFLLSDRFADVLAGAGAQLGGWVTQD
jgi:predicted glycoside hydrolase/deacetylase ChbG (UPF0249 family)